MRRNTRKRKKYKGGTRKRPLERGLRRVTLHVPEKTASGAFKTIWKVPGSRHVVINSTQEQTKDDKTPYRTQLQEFAFSKRLYTFFPKFFPEVSFLKGNEKELNVIDQLKQSNTGDKRLKYIWLKENCPPPSDEEIQNTYLKKAIQLLVDLMEQSLCYIDIKPMNLGKRGQSYLVIDTGREDIYYVPKQYQEDYLKGEILICGMCIYHYLKDKGLDIPYDKIIPAFSLVIPPLKDTQENFIDTHFKDKLQSYLKGETINIPENIEGTIKSFRTRLYRTYLNEEQKKEILEEQKEIDLNNKDDLYMISARLNDYAKLNQIGQFFRDSVRDKSTPLSPSSLDFLNE